MLVLDEVAVGFPVNPENLMSGVSFELPVGQLMALVGPNGSGKTTLLRVMCGLIRPRGGTVELDGQDVVRKPERAQREIGVSLYPERSFYYRLSAEQNLLYFAALKGLRRRTARAEVDRVLGCTQLEEHRGVPFMRLSLGMRKRLGVARAMMGAPRTLLLDEPFANLDGASAEALAAQLHEMRVQGHRVVISTHEASALAGGIDVVGQLEQGSLRTTRDPSELLFGKALTVITSPPPGSDTPIGDWRATASGFSTVVPREVDVLDALVELREAGYSISQVGTRQETSIVAPPGVRA